MDKTNKTNKEPETNIIHVAVFKACPLSKPVKNLRITADQCFDDLPEECRKNFDSDTLMKKDAERFFHALKETLPRGTLNRLLILFLEDQCKFWICRDREIDPLPKEGVNT